MKRIVVVGAGVMDVLLKSDSFRVLKSHQVPGGVAMCEVMGGKMEAEEGEVTSGGGGTNVAVGLLRLGEAVRVVTRIGEDDLGDVMIKQLGREGVDLSMVQRGGETGVSVVLVAQDGGRSIITHRGASAEISAKAIDWKMMEKADWIQVSSLGGNVELLEDLVNFSYEHRIGVGVNPGGKELKERERIMRMLPKVTYLDMNRMETAMLLGHDYEKEIELMEKVAGLGVKIISVTDGKRGASVVADGRWIKMGAFRNKSVDDTGAGDAFASGMVKGILAGWEMSECLKLGLANGASVVGQMGAKKGLLNDKEVGKWMRRKIGSKEQQIV